SFAECNALPTGAANATWLTNTYLNIPRARHVWKSANFQGQIVVGDFQYVAGATVPAAAWYYQADTTAQTLTTIGTDTFDGNGNVSRRTSFEGRVHSTALSAGQSQTVNFKVKVLAPPGTADETQQEVITYNGNEEITLPGGRLTACKVTSVVSSVAGGVTTELSQEQMYLAKDLGLVKSYYKPTAMIFILDRDQTKLTELISTSAAVSYASNAATSTPSLASCGAMPAGQTLTVTASNSQEAANVKRLTQVGSFNGAPTLQVNRRSIVPDELQSVQHFDPTQEALKLVGEQAYTNGAVSGTITYAGQPDLSGVALSQTLPYTVTITKQPANTTVSSADSFTFLGYEKITTPAGTFDTCKVRFNYSANNNGGSETYWLIPNMHWGRLERIDAQNVRTTRELISKS
ncbi:MAG TPA: hypothetical protein VKI18_02615, partial [Albitalea sp.]|nr:hypothetical protein [Albitalea sp.]